MSLELNKQSIAENSMGSKTSCERGPMPLPGENHRSSEDVEPNASNRWMTGMDGGAVGTTCLREGRQGMGTNMVSVKLKELPW